MNNVQTDGAAVRASDAEREQTAEILRASYAEGRLTRADLDERLAVVYGAKTRTDLCDLTGDLPGATTAPTMPGRSAMVTRPLAGRDCGTGSGPDLCLLLCLLCAFPPAGIVYWILTAHRQPLAAREPEALLRGRPGRARAGAGEPRR
jgi:hypothetical protein